MNGRSRSITTSLPLENGEGGEVGAGYHIGIAKRSGMILGHPRWSNPFISSGQASLSEIDGYVE